MIFRISAVGFMAGLLAGWHDIATHDVKKPLSAEASDAAKGKNFIIW